MLQQAATRATPPRSPGVVTLPSNMVVARKPVKKQVKSTQKKVADPLFPARKKNFRVGRDIQPKVDLSRFVKWPRYIRLQRQRKILVQRLKVPPSINQFSKTLDKNQATELLKVLMKYQPEDKKAKQQRLKEIAAAKEAGKEPAPSKAPKVIKFGLKHVTTLIEEKKASLVVIAHDVNPIELVVWLPALCRKMGIPYCIMKGKARLGTLVHQKNASVICLTQVNKEDESKLSTLKSNFLAQFNEGFQRKWGGGIMGLKTQRKLEKRQKAIEAELAKKAQY